jgi:3alpha(or 20beta)-hydroxysteroid dehydrogenase
VFSLDCKLAVITGAASGIGLATAERFTNAGAKVVLADITDASSEASRLGGWWVKTDVGDELQVMDLMRSAAELGGRIDICVNNAGIGTEAPLQTTSREELARNWTTNTIGVFLGMKHAVPYMPPGSAIVNTSSIAGVLGYPTYAAYAASKWAVVGLTKVAALEYGPRGIRVNCVCPSSVNTPMLRNMASRESETAALLAAAPIDQLLEPDHIAAAMHFLVAEDCPLISGQAVVIDGGATAGISTRIIELARRGVVDAF